MSSVATVPPSDSLHGLQVLDAEHIEAMPWTPLAGCGGVEQKVLWNLGGFTQALAVQS